MKNKGISPRDNAIQVLMIYNSPENLGDKNVVYAVARLLVENVFGGECNKNLLTACINARSKMRPMVPWLRKMYFFNFVGPSNCTNKIWNRLFPSDTTLFGCPKFVVSRLGKAEHANVALAEHYKIPNISVGDPKFLDDSEFSIIISNNQERTGSNYINVETVPSNLFPNDVASAELRFIRKMGLDPGIGPVWCMLLGGNCPGYEYGENDWFAIASLMERCARRYGVRWVVSSSRRTGHTAEMLLRKIMTNQDWLLDAIWWGDGNRGDLAAYLGISDVFFVTEESESMISECVSIGKPIYTYVPFKEPDSNVSLIAQDVVTRVERFITRMVRNGRVRRLFNNNGADVDYIEDTMNSFIPMAAEERWDQVVLKALEERKMLTSDARVFSEA